MITLRTCILVASPLKFNRRDKAIFYHLYVWTVSLAAAVVPLAMQEYGYTETGFTSHLFSFLCSLTSTSID
jgi:hypothetical protein